MRVIAVVAAVASLVFVNLAQAIEQPASQRREAAQLRIQARDIMDARKAVWKCQDSLGVSRARASSSGWSLPPSIPYRAWVLGRWEKRASDCLEALRNRTIPNTNDWVTAVALVQRIYPSTADWLLYISRREGGHGGFVMNHQGSGAGGWMQFMSSTYYRYSGEAFADARRRGFVLPNANSWTHPLGQAITAGYMRFTGKDGCHWCL